MLPDDRRRSKPGNQQFTAWTKHRPAWSGHIRSLRTGGGGLSSNERWGDCSCLYLVSYSRAWVLFGKMRTSSLF